MLDNLIFLSPFLILFIFALVIRPMNRAFLNLYGPLSMAGEHPDEGIAEGARHHYGNILTLWFMYLGFSLYTGIWGGIIKYSIDLPAEPGAWEGDVHDWIIYAVVTALTLIALARFLALTFSGELVKIIMYSCILSGIAGLFLLFRDPVGFKSTLNFLTKSYAAKSLLGLGPSIFALLLGCVAMVLLTEAFVALLRRWIQPFREVSFSFVEEMLSYLEKVELIYYFRTLVLRISSRITQEKHLRSIYWIAKDCPPHICQAIRGRFNGPSGIQAMKRKVRIIAVHTTKNRANLAMFPGQCIKYVSEQDLGHVRGVIINKVCFILCFRVPPPLRGKFEEYSSNVGALITSPQRVVHYCQYFEGRWLS